MEEKQVKSEYLLRGSSKKKTFYALKVVSLSNWQGMENYLLKNYLNFTKIKFIEIFSSLAITEDEFPIYS